MKEDTKAGKEEDGEKEKEEDEGTRMAKITWKEKWESSFV